jgi:hypothetical protein
MTASSQLVARVVLNGAADLGTPTTTETFIASDTLASGTGLDQADQFWSDSGTLASTASATLDIAGGITNSLNETATFAIVKWLKVRVTSTNTADILSIGGAASNAWESWVGAAGDIVKVGPGGSFSLENPSAAGYPVAAGSGDQLKLTNGGTNTLSYEIMIVGVKA